MNQSTVNSDLNDPNDHVDGLSASLPPLPGLGPLQTQEFVVTENLDGIEPVHFGTRQYDKATSSDTAEDVQVNRNVSQDDCQANNHNDDAPSICATHNQSLNQDSSGKSKRKRIRFVNQCIRARKSFFLASSNDLIYDEIGNDVLLNGKILSAPSKGTEVYRFFWDTSPLTIPIDESKLRVAVHRDDKDNVNALKRARILFDEEYPNGAPPGVLSIKKTPSRKKSSANAKIQQSVI